MSVQRPSPLQPRNTRVSAVQSPTREQDAAPVARRMSCSKCQITYYLTVGSSSACPLCAAETEVRLLSQELRDTMTHLTKVENQLTRVKSHVDLAFAVSDALPITSLDDLVWLKSVLYRWRDDKGSLRLNILHGKPTGRGRNRKVEPNGFLLLPRNAEGEEYQCSSIGGIAIAGYYEEAMRLGGPVRALEILLKGLASVMPAVNHKGELDGS